MLAPSAARWLLALHTGLGIAAVVAGTSFVLGLRGYLRGARARRSVVKLAAIFLGLQIAAFGIGNAMYPTYKVEVRTAYLENPKALAADHPGGASEELVRSAAQAARWFDVKEHWVALGLLASAAALLILAFWDRARDGAAFAPIVLALASIACATVWLGAIVGFLTTAWRAV